jgi:hypothetical protein
MRPKSYPEWAQEEKVTTGYTRQHNKKLHVWYSPTNITGPIKLRR